MIHDRAHLERICSTLLFLHILLDSNFVLKWIKFMFTLKIHIENIFPQQAWHTRLSFLRLGGERRSPPEMLDRIQVRDSQEWS